MWLIPFMAPLRFLGVSARLRSERTGTSRKRRVSSRLAIESLEERNLMSSTLGVEETPTDTFELHDIPIGSTLNVGTEYTAAGTVEAAWTGEEGPVDPVFFLIWGDKRDQDGLMA